MGAGAGDRVAFGGEEDAIEIIDVGPISESRPDQSLGRRGNPN
jgi:hypothetical protein